MSFDFNSVRSSIFLMYLSVSFWISSCRSFDSSSEITSFSNFLASSLALRRMPRMPTLASSAAFFTAFLGEGGHCDTQDLAVVDGVEAQVGVQDGLGDVAKCALVERLYHDHAGVGAADVGGLLDGHRRAIVFNHNAVQHGRTGFSCPDALKFMLQMLDGVVHAFSGFVQYKLRVFCHCFKNLRAKIGFFSLRKQFCVIFLSFTIQG